MPCHVSPWDTGRRRRLREVLDDTQLVSKWLLTPALLCSLRLGVCLGRLFSVEASFATSQLWIRLNVLMGGRDNRWERIATWIAPLHWFLIIYLQDLTSKVSIESRKKEKVQWETTYMEDETNARGWHLLSHCFVSPEKKTIIIYCYFNSTNNMAKCKLYIQPQLWNLYACQESGSPLDGEMSSLGF